MPLGASSKNIHFFNWQSVIFGWARNSNVNAKSVRSSYRAHEKNHGSIEQFPQFDALKNMPFPYHKT
jgi:hypothetical protein